MLDIIPFGRKGHNGLYNPFMDFEKMRANFFNNFSFSDLKTDIKDNGGSYLLEADLPGFKKQDISIDIDENYLTIYAERHSEIEEKGKEDNYIKRERSYGSFTRSFDISAVKADEIVAEYSDGVLKLTMPKKENDVSNFRQIEIQ